jgi:short subunit dehydrogenase-like uncharacterized protein
MNSVLTNSVTVNKIVVFGATGYTGSLVVEAMVTRGLKPVLAGRNETRLREMAERLGLSWQRADVNDIESIKALVGKGDLLVSTVGPFMRYGQAAIEAAVAQGAHYIDSTGEPDFVRYVVEAYGQKARQSGSCILPAAAYDYFPGQCVAAQALLLARGSVAGEQVAQKQAAGEQATRVDIGYYGIGQDPLVLSDGTKESILQIMTVPGRFWRGGRLVTGVGGTRLRRFRVANRLRPAISVSTSEAFFLPESFPGVQDINVYLGWFGLWSYLLQVLALSSALFLKLPGASQWLQKLTPYLFKSQGKGPDLNTRQRGASQVLAIVYNGAGKELSRFELNGVHGYTFTANILAWVAEQIIHHGKTKPGVRGPVALFGAALLLEGCQQAGLHPAPDNSPQRIG